MTGTSSLTEEEYRRLSPFRLTGWRWAWALELQAGKAQPSDGVDPAVLRALEFLTASPLARTEEQRQQLRLCFPDLSAAHDIHLAGGLVRDEIEARLLAGQSWGAIAAQVSVWPDVIECYAQLFYDVADRLDCTDWLHFHAVRGASSCPGQVTEGDTWRYMALAGGPIVVDIMVADFLGRRESMLPDRAVRAKQMRWLARDHFDFADFGGRINPGLLEEGIQLFSGAQRACTDEQTQILASQTRFLRLCSRTPAQKERATTASAPKQPSRPGPSRPRNVEPTKPLNPQSDSWKTKTPMA